MTARIWYNNGCKTLEDIAARKGGLRLSYAQEIGLKYYTGAKNLLYPGNVLLTLPPRYQYPNTQRRGERNI